MMILDHIAGLHDGANTWANKLVCRADNSRLVGRRLPIAGENSPYHQPSTQHPFIGDIRNEIGHSPRVDVAARTEVMST
jgi:hypothetical protein